MPYLQIKFSCGNELTLSAGSFNIEHEDHTTIVGQGTALRGVAVGVRETAAEMIQTTLQEWSKTQKSSARASRKRWPQRAGTKNPFSARFNWR